MKKKNKYINIYDFIQDDYRTTFILGARGVGKTISALANTINRCCKNNTKAVYLRRYQTDVDNMGVDLNLLSELTGKTISRNFAEINGLKQDFILADGEPVIYLLSLNTAGKYKSTSYKDVEIIIYDEFLDLKNRELKKETTMFVNLAMTIFRDFTKYKAVFLANSTNLFNCYFIDFEVIPTGKITKYRDKSIKIVMYQTSDELDNERMNTPLAIMSRMVETGGSSSLDNIFAGNLSDYLRKLDGNCEYKATFKLDNQYFGMYFNPKTGMTILSRKADLSYKLKFALTYDDVTPDYPLINNERYWFARDCLMHNRMYFTDVKTRAMFFKRLRSMSVINY